MAERSSSAGAGPQSACTRMREKAALPQRKRTPAGTSTPTLANYHATRASFFGKSRRRQCRSQIPDSQKLLDPVDGESNDELGLRRERFSFIPDFGRLWDVLVLQRFVDALILIYLVGLAPGCAGHSEPDSDRTELFAITTGASPLRDHRCEPARLSVAATVDGMPTLEKRALRANIDAAKLTDVQRCLAEVRAYDDCYLALACGAFAESVVPAWLLGPELAPCGCGVTNRERAGPFASPLPLPDTLASCVGIFPVIDAGGKSRGTCP